MQRSTATSNEIEQIMEDAKIQSAEIAFGTDEKNIDLIDIKNDHITYGAASLSKPVFTYLVLKLINDTDFRLDAKLNEIASFSAFCEKNNIQWDNSQENIDRVNLFTPKMVLTHKTGLPIGYKKEDGLLKFDFEPDQGFGYTGISLMYLQECIQVKFKKSLEELAKEYVFRPAHLTALTTFNTPEANAANSLYTTPADYARFCIHWMNDPDPRVQEAFKNENMVSLRNDPWAVREGISGKILDHLFWGYGWGIEKRDNGDIIAFHTGDMGEWRSGVQLNLTNKSVKVFFSKSDYGNGHLLQEPIFGKSYALDYFFDKYKFAKTVNELRDDWRENDRWGIRKAPVRFGLSVEGSSDSEKTNICFVYKGHYSNNKNLMLVVFPLDDSKDPEEIPMPYSSETDEYKANLETADICQRFLVTTAANVGDKKNPTETVLQKGYFSLMNGILQPVNKIPGVPEGILETFLLTKNGELIKPDKEMNAKPLQEGDRFLTIYFPHGYYEHRELPYKLQFTLDGGQYLNHMSMNVIMDNLIASGEIDPVVNVFISPHSGPPKKDAKGYGLVIPEGYTLAMRLQEYSCNPEFAEKLAALPSKMRQHFNISKDREDITVWGMSAGGLQAAYTGLLHPDVFGNVVAESMESWNIPMQNGKNWRDDIVETFNEKGNNITWSTATDTLPKIEGKHNEHITQMVSNGRDSISGANLDKSKPIRFYLNAGEKEEEYDPRLEVGSANLLKGAKVFAAAAELKGHIIVDGEVHVISNGIHHNMTWMRNQATIMKSMHGSPKLHLEKTNSESLLWKESRASIKNASVSSQSTFSHRREEKNINVSKIEKEFKK